MSKIGIFYGSTTGNTEQLANDIAAKLGVATEDVHNVGESSADDVDGYDVLLLGSSSWGEGELQDDWYDFLDNLKAKDLSGKKVGLFGCGDSGSNPDTFCGAVAALHDGLKDTGCTFIGAYTPEGYDVTDSAVCQDGKFVGLAIDGADPDSTDARVAAWTELIKNA